MERYRNIGANIAKAALTVTVIMNASCSGETGGSTKDAPPAPQVATPGEADQTLRLKDGVNLSPGSVTYLEQVARLGTDKRYGLVVIIGDQEVGSAEFPLFVAVNEEGAAGLGMLNPYEEQACVYNSGENPLPLAQLNITAEDGQEIPLSLMLPVGETCLEGN